MYHNVEKQFTFNIPSPFPYDLVFEFECQFTFSDDQEVLLKIHDVAIGEKTFRYKDSGSNIKNLLYGWHLCSNVALAQALELAQLDPVAAWTSVPG
ncbi:MAG: hypothetical protein KAJ19_26235 [Gammaproteobacteria bacterium]|nr:hypothetical protein [Gammaproteobacteria bacterium]